MINDDFIKLCKSNDWDKLFDFIRTGYDVTQKIVATALVEVHHPDKEIRKKLGLRNWDARLFNYPVQSLSDGLQGNVDLIDFTKAYLISTNGLNAESQGLNDSKVADAIKAYVYTHRSELNETLQCEYLEEKFKENIRISFGHLMACKNNIVDDASLKVTQYRFTKNGSATKHGFFARSQSQLDKEQELSEKQFSDVKLAASDFGQGSNTARSLKNK